MELFGCRYPDGSLAPSLSVEKYPTKGYLMGGVYLDNADSQVLACGGLSCATDTSGCAVTEKCYKWTPELDEWTEDVPLTRPR